MTVHGRLIGGTAWHAVPPHPGRRARATAGQLVYAVGDIHGCYLQLRALLGLIAEDAAQTAAGRCPVLILCGDYIDRGPYSAEVLEAVIWLKAQGRFELHALRGNHEQACLDFLARPDEGGWLSYGGIETLQSYGVAPPTGEDDRVRVRDALLACMPAAHLRLLEELPLAVEVGDYAFVHAGIRPGRPLAAQASGDLLWIRDPFLESEADHGLIVVHGHTWEDEHPQLKAHRIGLDTGTYATGVLTALRLDGPSVAYAQVHA